VHEARKALARLVNRSDELRAGGDASLVRTHGDPAEAAAVVCVVGEGATPSDEQVLRAATRALVPVIGVRTGSSGAPILGP